MVKWKNHHITYRTMEAIIWKDKTVSYKEEGSEEVITTTPFISRNAAILFVKEKLGIEYKD
jgi:hypothetical protein